jgi:hypothetical protein
MMVAGECKRDNGEDDEVGTAREVWWELDASAWIC